MAHRCEQSRFRRRHRHDRCPHVHTLPERKKRHRANAPTPLLDRRLLTPTLLATLAPAKRHTTHHRLRPRHRLGEPHFKRHLRCPSEEGHRWSRLPLRDLRVPASLLATPPRRFRPINTDSTPIQDVARATRRATRRRVLHPRTHGRTRRRHVSPPATSREHCLRRDNDCHLFHVEPHQNTVLLPARSFLFGYPDRSRRAFTLHRTRCINRHRTEQPRTRTPLFQNRALLPIRHRLTSAFWLVFSTIFLRKIFRLIVIS